MAHEVVFCNHAEHLVSQTPAATPLDGGGLFPWWLHYDKPAAAALNACRFPGQRCVFPPHPEAGRERWAYFLISLIVTVDVSRAYTF